MDSKGQAGELLTAGLVHELRHPLMGMKLGLQLIARAVGKELSSQAEWPMVLAQLDRMEGMLRSYQQFLAPDPGKPTRFDLDPVVRQAIELCRLRLQALGDRFTYRAPPIEVLAHGTADALTHALTNIIHNAVDAMEQKGGLGRLEVRILPSVSDEGRVEVRISDEGPGIPEELASRIFEPRFSTKGRGKGSGLGLSIARRMIEAVGGQVALVEPNDILRQRWAKTEFKIVLVGDWPRQPGVDVPPEPAPLPVARPPLADAMALVAAEPGKARSRVLLVEDDLMIGAMLKRGLESKGYEVTTATNGDEGIALISSARFDAVVTDKNLPGKSGIEVGQALRKIGPDVALLMMTGFASRESARALQDLQADGYLPKPFEIEALLQALDGAIMRRKSRSRRRDELRQGRAPAQVGRIAVLEGNPKDLARLARLIGDRKMVPLARTDLGAVLDEQPQPDGIIMDSSSLTTPTQQRLLDLQAERPELQVVLISNSDNLLEAITSMSLGVTEQLFRPWTDEQAEGAVQRAFSQRPK